jgi:predicted Zn-dependent peptidase
MALILAGDFDPDEAIKVIDKYFGQITPKTLPEFKFEPEQEIEEPVKEDVVGLEAEQIRIGFRFPGASSREALMADLVSMMLSNGKAGLIDLNVNLQQKTLAAGAFLQKMADYSSFQLYGMNKSNQTLEQVADILLEQVEILKLGEFPDWMLEATINNLKLNEMRRIESNRGRVWMMHNSYVNDIQWEDAINYIDELGTITKDEIVAFANKNLGDNYAVVYKRQGAPDVELVEKPSITPIHINRDVESEFMKEIKERTVTPIEPVFINFDKDFNKLTTANNIEVLHKENVENNTFQIYYYFPFGSDNDKMFDLAAGYLEYLGTSEFSPEEIKQEFYKLACSFNVFSSRDETYVSINGLSDNQEAAVQLLESLMTDCQPNDIALTSYVQNVLRSRENAKQNQRNVFRGLVNYATYGPNSPFTNEVGETELNELKAETLVQKIKELSSYPHKILYYGTYTPEKVVTMIETVHSIPESFNQIPEPFNFAELETKSNRVVFSHYEANQSYLQLVSRGVDFSLDLLPSVEMFNNYFGTGMSAIVFQELREKRGLAYTAWSRYSVPNSPDKPFMNNGFIATQNDKLIDAFSAFDDLYNNIPVSETSFTLAKESILNGIRNERITKLSIIFNYLNAQKMGYDFDIRKTYFEKIPTMSIDDVISFNKEYIKDKPKTYVILGNERVVNFKEVSEKFGPVEKISREEIFNF